MPRSAAILSTSVNLARNLSEEAVRDSSASSFKNLETLTAEKSRSPNSSFISSALPPSIAALSSAISSLRWLEQLQLQRLLVFPPEQVQE